MNAFYHHLGTDKNLANSVNFYQSLIRIPIYPDLEDDEVEDIVKAVTKVCCDLKEIV